MFCRRRHRETQKNEVKSEAGAFCSFQVAVVDGYCKFWVTRQIYGWKAMAGK